MKSPRLYWFFGPLLLIGVFSELAYYLGQESLLFSEERLAVEVLDDSIEPLRQRFESGADRWRMVILASPMAPTTTAGLDRLLDEFLLPNPDLPIQISVIFFHGLPWDHRGKARTRPRWSLDQRWSFYWDPEERVATALTSERTGTSTTNAPLLSGRFLVYGPERSWARGRGAPPPDLVLSALARLNGGGDSATADKFGRELIELEQQIRAHPSS